MDNKLRIIFMGTPDFAVPALQALIASGHDVVAVYTRAPKPKGRGQHVQNTPVHDLALSHNIPVFTPISLRKSPEDQAQFIALKADVAVVAAYGLLLPPAVLSAPRFGCINIHGSLLPKYRGAAPIQRALLNGDAETGITIMQMAQGMDTGDMIVSDRLPIGPDQTSPDLFAALSKMGARLMIRVLDDLMLEGHVHATPQNEALATHAPMLTKEEGRLDFTRLSADQVDSHVRGMTPWPGSYVDLSEGQVLKILSGRKEAGEKTNHLPGTIIDSSGRIACADGSVYTAGMVQAPSGKKMDMKSFLNGGMLRVMDRLGS